MDPTRLLSVLTEECHDHTLILTHDSLPVHAR